MNISIYVLGSCHTAHLRAFQRLRCQSVHIRTPLLKYTQTQAPDGPPKDLPITSQHFSIVSG